MFKIKAASTLQMLMESDGEFHIGLTKLYIQDANAEIGRQAKRIAELEALVPESDFLITYKITREADGVTRAKTAADANAKLMNDFEGDPFQHVEIISTDKV